MPTSNASHFPQSFVSLARKLFCSSSMSDSFESVTFCHSDHIDHFVLAEHIHDRKFLLKPLKPELNLFLDSPSIDLELHNMRLLDSEVHNVSLRVD